MYKLLVTTVLSNRYVQAPSIAVGCSVSTVVIEFDTQREADDAIAQINASRTDDLFKQVVKLY